MGLPAGVSLGMVAAVLIPVCVIQFLGATMPVGVMTVLVVYTLSSSHQNPGGIGAALVAAGITLVLHAWKHRAGLSILVGTAIYMVLVNLVF